MQLDQFGIPLLEDVGTYKTTLKPEYEAVTCEPVVLKWGFKDENYKDSFAAKIFIENQEILFKVKNEDNELVDGKKEVLVKIEDPIIQIENKQDDNARGYFGCVPVSIEVWKGKVTVTFHVWSGV